MSGCGGFTEVADGSLLVMQPAEKLVPAAANGPRSDAFESELHTVLATGASFQVRCGSEDRERSLTLPSTAESLSLRWIGMSCSGSQRTSDLPLASLCCWMGTRTS